MLNSLERYPTVIWTWKHSLMPSKNIGSSNSRISSCLTKKKIACLVSYCIESKERFFLCCKNCRLKVIFVTIKVYHRRGTWMLERAKRPAQWKFQFRHSQKANQRMTVLQNIPCALAKIDHGLASELKILLVITKIYGKPRGVPEETWVPAWWWN